MNTPLALEKMLFISGALSSRACSVLPRKSLSHRPGDVHSEACLLPGSIGVTYNEGQVVRAASHLSSSPSEVPSESGTVQLGTFISSDCLKSSQRQ